jgi:hypothetical protein
MIFCLRNFNEVFLKYALRQTIFGSSFLTKEEMIDEFLSILKYFKYYHNYLIDLDQKLNLSSIA